MGAKTSKTTTATTSRTAKTNIQDNSHLITPQTLLNRAKERFYEGNEAFRDAKFDHAKNCYYEALENLKKWNDNLHPRSSNHTAKEGEGQGEGGDRSLEECKRPEDQSTNHLETATMMNLGMLQFIEGCYNESKDLLQQALDKHREWRSCKMCDESSQCLTSASVLIKRDLSLLKGETNFHNVNEKVMISKLNEYSTLDAMIADLLNNLAACYEVMGELSLAKTLFEECLQLRVIVYGKDSLKVAETMQNLATIFDGIGATDRARSFLSEALEIEKKELGEEHIETAVTMNNLGVLLAHMHNYDEARQLLEKSVQLRESFYGPHHHLTTCARQNLDFVLSHCKATEKKD